MSGDRRAQVLVVEDEKAIAEGLLLNLQRKNYETTLATDGEQALELARSHRYDLILLDIRPVLDGFDVCQKLRARGDFTPILMLTARNQPDDIVYGLKLGSDDYVVKPFDLAELLARVGGLLRRKTWSDGERIGGLDRDARFCFGNYWVDFRTWQAKTLSGVVELSQKELAVFKIFAERPNEVITRRELLANVWELPNHPNTRVVDNVIVALRRAFEKHSWRPRHFHSVRGAGYRFTP
ncbi:MAG: response regulator transcription factor [Acidobacteria bacterium]|nr:MAG: response regulator transcription factor [Acidobacteriota bacterium]